MQKVVLGKVVGKDGVNGREIELRATAKHIQWHYAGDAEWIDILPLSAITGPQGLQGVEGKKLMLQATSEFVQFKYEGETTWTNLVALSELQGSQGPQGERGLQGVQGDAGSQLRYGQGVPTVSIGVKGDSYVDTSSDLWDVYYKSSTTQWDKMGQMKGEAGGLGGDTVPIGVMLPSTTNITPDGWLLCDGALVSRKDYAELFGIIGTSYGAGDGSTTFALPNEPNPLTHAMVDDNTFQMLSREPELYMIIKAKQLVPVVASVEDSLASDSNVNVPSVHAVSTAMKNMQGNTQVIDQSKIRVFACANGTTQKYYAGTYDDISCIIHEMAGRVFVDFSLRVLTIGDIANAPDGAYLFVEIEGLKENKYSAVAYCAISLFNLPAGYTNVSIAPYIVDDKMCFILNKTGMGKTAYAVNKSEIIDRTRITASINYVAKEVN